MNIVTISPAYRLIQKIATPLSKVYGSYQNPIYYLGAITVFLLIIDVISGIYLFFFYDVDPQKAYDSVEAISSSFLGNIMRGLHRYSSDGLILFAILHMLHMIFTDRFRMFRWVAWVSGVATLLIFLTIGISGYLLVWDERAQLIGILTAKFFSIIPIFGHSLMSAFLGTDIKNLSGMFRILLFGHIAVTILLIFTLWIHVMRISRPRIFPPKTLMILLTAYLVIISIVFPARSDPPADLGKVPFSMSMDWFYLTGYPLFKVFPLSVNWILFIAFFGFLTVFPWIIKGRRNPPAHVIEEKCEGCEQCFMDCPYEAIDMRIKGDKKKAYVLEDRCAGCGICVASCSYGANEIPTVPVNKILEDIKNKKPILTVFRCPFSAEVNPPENTLVFTLPCAGALNTVWIKDFLKYTKGIALISCDGPDCYFREGTLWSEERFKGKRRPRLLKRISKGRVLLLEATNVEDVSKEIRDFKEKLEKEEFEEDIKIISKRKLNYVLASVILFIPFLTFYPLTTHKMWYYPQDKSLLVLTFKYRSSPVKEVKKAFSQLEHMKAVSSIALRRSSVELEVNVNGKTLLRKKYDPRGLRKDASIYIYEEFLLNPGSYTVKVKLRELEGKKREYEYEVFKNLKETQTLAITFSEDRGFFELKGRN